MREILASALARKLETHDRSKHLFIYLYLVYLEELYR